MRATGWALAVSVMASGAATAGEPVARVALHAAPTASAAAFRLKTVTVPVDPTFRLGDPQSKLQSGYGGSMVDLFPFEGGKFHLSGGGRLFGRPGRARNADPESLHYLPSFRAGGPRMSRRFSPAMLVGYGHTVDQGLTFGIDAGMVMGRINAMPDRAGRLNRSRIATETGQDRMRGRRSGMNELARVTALYRF